MCCLTHRSAATAQYRGKHACQRPKAMAEMTGEMLATTLSAQARGLNLLLAEMRALSEVLPGALAQPPGQRAHVDAANEADFDNMPV